MAGYVLGIDLGTTYSAAAIHRDGRAQIVSLGTRSAAIPSTVFVRSDLSVATGDAAERRSVSESERVARAFKRRLGDTTPMVVGGSVFSPESLMAKLLEAIVDKVTELEGEPPRHIVLCHPANWGEFKTDRLRQAVGLARLHDVTLLTEPEAAAIHYAATEHLSIGEVVAVYDLGGGSFDAAILRRTSTGFEFIGQPEGLENLGGLDFDAAVFDHVRTSLGGAMDALDPDDRATTTAVARVREECVEAKESLSSESDASIAIVLPNVVTELRLTRAELERMIRPMIADTITSLERTLQGANLGPDEISKVLLVGGSSRIPLVAEMVSGALGRPIAVDAHPKYAIALGASVAAAAAMSSATAADIAESTVLEAPPEPVDVVPTGSPRDGGSRRATSPAAEKPKPRLGKRLIIALGVAATVIIAIVVLVATRDEGKQHVSASTSTSGSSSAQGASSAGPSNVFSDDVDHFAVAVPGRFEIADLSSGDADSSIAAAIAKNPAFSTMSDRIRAQIDRGAKMVAVDLSGDGSYDNLSVTKAPRFDTTSSDGQASLRGTLASYGGTNVTFSSTTSSGHQVVVATYDASITAPDGSRKSARGWQAYVALGDTTWILSLTSSADIAGEFDTILQSFVVN